MAKQSVSGEELIVLIVGLVLIFAFLAVFEALGLAAAALILSNFRIGLGLFASSVVVGSDPSCSSMITHGVSYESVVFCAFVSSAILWHHGRKIGTWFGNAVSGRGDTVKALCSGLLLGASLLSNEFLITPTEELLKNRWDIEAQWLAGGAGLGSGSLLGSWLQETLLPSTTALLPVRLWAMTHPSCYGQWEKAVLFGRVAIVGSIAYGALTSRSRAAAAIKRD